MMATGVINPQIENGYTKIANELLDFLATFRIPGEQMQCLLFIIRKTYGYNKKVDKISLSQFVAGTGISRRNVCRALKNLNDKKIIKIKKGGVKKDTTETSQYSVNKLCHTWLGSVKKDTGSVNIDTEVVSKKTHTKEKNKRKEASTFFQEQDHDQDKNKKPFSDNKKPLSASCFFDNFLENKKIEKGFNSEYEQMWDSVNIFVEKTINDFGLKAPKKTDRLIIDSFKTIEMLIRIDGFTWQYVKEVLAWAYKDSFWRSNFLSLAGLRKKKDGLTKFQKMAAAHDKFKPEPTKEVKKVYFEFD